MTAHGSKKKKKVQGHVSDFNRLCFRSFHRAQNSACIDVTLLKSLPYFYEYEFIADKYL